MDAKRNNAACTDNKISSKKTACETKKLEAISMYRTENCPNDSSSKPKKSNKNEKEGNILVENEISLNETNESSASTSLHSVMRDTIQRYNNSMKKLEPYELYESGKCTSFFDKNSSTLDKGRFRVRDARHFAPESMRRRKDPECSNNSIMLLVGKILEDDKVDNKTDDAKNSIEEQVITIIFDRSEFSEKDALDWWNENRRRFI